MKQNISFWHIQMNQPNGRGKIKIDSRDLLMEDPPVIGTGDWDDDQCRNFQGTRPGAMKIGDVVLVREGKHPIALCEVTSECFRDDLLKQRYINENFRTVKVLSFFDGAAEALLSESLRKYNTAFIQASGTLTACKADNATSYFIKNWYKQLIGKMSMDNLAKTLKNNKNLILTGAPGTGKTYLAKALAKYLIFGEPKEVLTAEEDAIFESHFGFVQFHPSYDYTDFVEGLRPTPPDASGNIGFELRNGIFKEFCQKAIRTEDKKFDAVYQAFVDDALESDHLFETPVHGRKFRVEISKNNSCIVIPQTEAATRMSITKKMIEDYLYHDYIRDWKPYVTSIGNYIKEHYLYDSLLPVAQTQDNRPFVFVIDEINRGEISKIFGELFFSIDPGYRGKEGKIQTQYANLQEDETVFDPELGKGWFYIPENVYLIGTMNDIDRSVESMDFAMRRRFAWKEIQATEGTAMFASVIPEFSAEAKDRMQSLNKVIENIPGLNSAYHIGPSYFLNLRRYEDNHFENLWENHIKGVLLEYLRGYPDMSEIMIKLRAAFNRS